MTSRSVLLFRYVAGPILGALIGVGFEWILRGKPTTAGAQAAQGFLGDDDSTPTARSE